MTTRTRMGLLPLASAAMILCTGPAGATPSADIVNGKPQTLKAHHSKHPAPPSLAQDAPRTVAPVTPKPYSGTPTDVLTYHYDQNRTGWNPTETDLTPATVKSTKFSELAVLKVDGNVFAQPLVVTNYKMPDATVHDVLVIVTGHNTVYAYDAKT